MSEGGRDHWLCSYNILPALSHEGYTAVDIFMTPVNREMFMEFLEESLVRMQPLYLHIHLDNLLLRWLD